MNDFKPELLYSDDDILIFSKPAGMIVNNADTSRKVFTLQDFVKKNYPLKVDKSDDEDFVNREGIVHRLDKETSGVILVARNSESFKNLQAQFKNRQVKKEYTALVHGRIVGEGEIKAPIGRLPWNRMRFGILPSGRESFTRFKVLEYRESKKTEEILSLVRVFPETGRTHQIRVHFQYAGFPIFSDALYAGRKTYAKDKKFLSRHFLHASSIEFLHPKTGKTVKQVAPFPEELEEFLNSLTVVKS